MKPLPRNRWNPITWKQATVHRDTHLQIDKALYSVPWKYVTQKLWVRCSKSEIDLPPGLRTPQVTRIASGCLIWLDEREERYDQKLCSRQT